MRYVVVTAKSLGELEMYVEDRLHGGWKLQGGVCRAKLDDRGYMYYQAMMLE